MSQKINNILVAFSYLNDFILMSKLMFASGSTYLKPLNGFKSDLITLFEVVDLTFC